MQMSWSCAGVLLWAATAVAQSPAPATTASRYSISPAAVASALTEAGLLVAPAHVHLPGALTARVELPAFTLSSAEQRGTGTLAVRMACRTTSECMPFFVTVDVAEQDRPQIAAWIDRTRAAPSVAVRSDISGVAVGARVRLELADKQMRIDFPAIAIDTGAPGTDVRVASLDRKHTWHGVVVDSTTVRGGLQ